MEGINKLTRLFLASLFIVLGVLTILGFFGVNVFGDKASIFSLSDSLMATGIIVLIEFAVGILLFLNKVHFSGNLTRVVVGTVFIFSGFIKANDPVGFGYKLTEYFEVFADDVSRTKIIDPVTKEETFKIDHDSSLRKLFHTMHDYSLALAIFMCVLEMVLGVTLLLGAFRMFTIVMLFLLVLFFGFLTFYSAYYEKVQSCGCFGDAIPLTPWQSFGKDLILTVMVLVLFYARTAIQPLISNVKILLIVTAVLLIPVIVFPFYTWNYLPIIDFRPYKIGTNIFKSIHTQMKYYYVLKNKKTGEQKEFDHWPEGWDKEYDYVTNRAVPVDPTIKPIVGFSIQNEKGEEYADEFLQKQGVAFMLVAYDLDKTDRGVQGRVNDFASLCAKDNIEFIGLTASDSLKIAAFKQETGAAYPFYRNPDDVPLKTMIRSNPGLILIKDGVVTELWHYHSFPSYNDVKEKYFK